jgi:DNA adenine methylase
VITTPESPAIRYHGGKWRLAPWIISQFPAHRRYVEPFAGGANVLLRKRPAEIEVYNDLNGQVVNFFRVLRERGDELARAIELTPFSREEYDRAHEPATDELETARRFYVLAWQGFGSPIAKWNTGWRWVKQGEPRSIRQWNRVDHLWQIAARLKWVYLERQPAIDIIKQFDTAETLVYCDPPYLSETRSKWRLSAYGDTEMTNDDHRQLADVLHGIEGMAIISGYPSALYDELYHDWQRVTCEAVNDAAKVTVECLWLSPAALRRGRQMRMFDESTFHRARSGASLQGGTWLWK